jgi:hypothetical protein
MEDVSSERKFLHDIATPITIASLLVQRLIKDRESEESQFSPQQTLEWLHKALAALKSLETMHADRKQEIHKLESGPTE